MTFPSDVADHKQDMRQKCFYILTLIKAKSLELYEKFHAQYESLKAEDSWDFYHTLVAEYKKLVDSADENPAAKKEAPKKEAKKAKPGIIEKAKAAVKKEVKKVVKSVVKAPAKKAPAKKAAPKKAAKKAPAKKAAPKKAAKKAPAKKVAKKKKK